MGEAVGEAPRKRGYLPYQSNFLKLLPLTQYPER